MANPYLAASGTSTATGAFNMTCASNVAIGDELVVCVSNNSGGISAVSDSAGNTYAFWKTNTNNSNCYQYSCKVTSALTAGTSTISVTAGGSGTNVVVAGVPGAIASPLDSTASTNANGSSGAPSVATGTLAQANEVLIAMINTTNAGGTPTWAAPFAGNTIGNAQYSAGGSIHLFVNYAVVSATTAVTASATITSAAWTIMVGCIEVSAAAPPLGPVTPARPGAAWRRQFQHRQELAVMAPAASKPSSLFPSYFC